MNETVERAAQYLSDLRRNSRTSSRLPEDFRPKDVETALAIQKRVGELMGETIGGWKCSAPSAGRVLAAPLYVSHIYRGPRCPVLHGSIEPEIAFALKQDLTPREHPYAEAEVAAAIGEARLVLEIIGSRYSHPKEAEFLEKLADSASNEALYVGPAIAGGVTPEMGAFPISIEARGESIVAVDGKHPDGHPMVPMHWLANFLSGRKEGLKAGDVITTGSYAGVIEVPVGEPLRVIFGDFGAIEVELTSIG